MRKILLITCFSVFTTISVLAQPYIQNIIDFEGRDFIQHSIAEYPGDNYVIAGTISPAPIAGDSDIVLMMVNNQGDIVWSQYIDYSDFGQEYFYDEFVGSVFVDRDENIVITGYTKLNPSGNLDSCAPLLRISLMIAKFDGSGNYISDIVLNETQLQEKENFHGFDIEETNDGNYIVVGLCAVEGYSVDTRKYAFVLGIDKHLEEPPLWIKFYESSSVNPSFLNYLDSFNHILKVEEHPDYGEVFLISGAAAYDTPLNHSVLIDNQGNQLWSTTHGLPNSSSISGAISALYDPSHNMFYVVSNVYRGASNPHQNGGLINIIVLDSNNGVVNDSWNVQDIEGYLPYNYLYINDMRWFDDEDPTSIVFSGYTLNSDTNLGNPFLISVDVHSKSVNWAYKYHFEFDTTDYQNLFGFNEIIQPLHNPFVYPYIYKFSQHFYRPKSLLRSYFDTNSWEGFQFSSVFQNRGTNFGLSFYNTDLNGHLAGDCFSDLRLSIESRNVYNEFSINPSYITLNRFCPTLQVYPVGFEPFLSCNEKSNIFNIEQSEIHDNKIYIYPNPTESLVNIESIGPIESIIVYNLFGQLIDVPINNNSLDFSTLAAGIYLIEIKTKESKETFRVVKK